MGLKHVGAKSVTSVTAYVILYSYIQVHKLVQIESIKVPCLFLMPFNVRWNNVAECASSYTFQNCPSPKLQQDGPILINDEVIHYVTQDILNVRPCIN